MQLLKPLRGINSRNIEEKIYVIKHDVRRKRSEPKGVTGENKQTAEVPTWAFTVNKKESY